MGSLCSARRGEFWRTDFVGTLERRLALKSALDDRDAFSIPSVLDLLAYGRYQDGDELARDLRAVLAASSFAPTPHSRPGDNNSTVAFRTSPVAVPQVMAAGNAFVSIAATPGYDATEKDRQARFACRQDHRDEQVGGTGEAPGRRREHRPGALTREL